MLITHTCAECGKTFVEDWSDKDILELGIENISNNKNVVCEDCFKKMIKGL